MSRDLLALAAALSILFAALAPPVVSAGHVPVVQVLAPADEGGIVQHDTAILKYTRAANATGPANLTGTILLYSTEPPIFEWIGEFNETLSSSTTNLTFDVATSIPDHVPAGRYLFRVDAYENGTQTTAAVYVHYGSNATDPRGFITSVGDLKKGSVVKLAYNASTPTDTLQGDLTLDGVWIANYTRTGLPEGNSTFNVAIQVTANLTSGWRTLRATFDNGNTLVDDARIVYYSGGEMWPPTLTIVRAEYVVGQGFRVNGTLAYSSNITNFTATTEYGTTQIPVAATWSTSIDVLPTHEGLHTLAVTATDDMGRSATQSVVVDVRAQNVTILSRNVAIGVGAHEEVLTIPLQARLISGRVNITTNGIANITGVIDADETSICAKAAAGGCPFSTRAGAGLAVLVWTQGPSSTVRLTVIGQRL